MVGGAREAARVYPRDVRPLALAPVGLLLLGVLYAFFRVDGDASVAGSDGIFDAGLSDADAGEVRDAAVPLRGAERAASRRREASEVAELRSAIEAARSTRLREAAQELREEEREGTFARGLGVGGEPIVGPEEDAERIGRLDPQYIRDAIRELSPLLRECYDLAREEAARDGRAAPEGRLVTRFVIGGEPDVGGVIEEAEVMDESDVRHPLLEECFTETLYTVELPAPEEGGRVTVHYPFVLRSAPPESAAPSAAPPSAAQ